MTNATTSVGDIRAGQYTTILHILEKINDRSYRFVDHKVFIRERIPGQNRDAARERKRQFIEQEQEGESWIIKMEFVWAALKQY